MKNHCVAIAVAILSLLPVHAAAQFKPSRSVEFVVHTGPGGGSDVFARILNTMFEQEKLLPVRVTIANKPGGGGAAAMAYMAEKKGDSHTIAAYTSVWIALPLTSSEAHVQFLDLTPIANLIFDPALIVVKPDAPYRTMADFIEAAKKAPGQLRQAGSSVQARGNLVRQLLQRRTGATWSHIPFPGGGDRIAAVLGGHAQLLIAEPGEIKSQVDSGALRVIAQIADKRLPGLPNVPTLQEAGFVIPKLQTIRGIIGPPGMPKEAVQYWEYLFERLVKTESWRKYLVESQSEDGYLKGAALAKFATENMAQRREVFNEIGIKTVR